MKKILLTGAVAATLLGAQFAHADIIPTGKKYVPTCAKVTNITAYPQLVIYAEETGPTLKTPNIWKPVENECIKVSYKFNDIKLYAVDSAYEKSKTSGGANTFDPAKDSHAYGTDIEIDVTPVLFDDTDKTDHVDFKYSIAGIDNSANKMVLDFLGSETNLTTQSGLPATHTPNLTDYIINKTTSFTDVPANSTYYDALTYLRGAGIVQGYEDGSFKPYKTINRAEFTKIIVGATQTDNGMCTEAYYDDKTKKYKNIFDDVTTTEWYSTPICIAVDEGLVSGYESGNFKPENEINFAEASKIVSKAYSLNGDQTTSPWFKGFVDALAGQKAIPETIVYKDQKITRGEMAEMIYRLATRNTSKTSKTFDQLK